MRYACAECGTRMTLANRSADTPDCCRDCGDYVWAYRPDEFDPTWYEIPDPFEPLLVRGGQCHTGKHGFCGVGQAIVMRSGRHGWAAVCFGQWGDGEFVEGCGAMHPVRRVARFRVVALDPPPVLDSVVSLSP